MNTLYIANWKSHKTLDEALSFLSNVKDNISQIDLSNKEIVIAPPFTLLSLCRDFINENNLPIKLSSQNVSSFPEGAYTGEVSAQQVKEFCDYAIVGHSERKKYLHESDMDIENKVREALEQGLAVVQCVQNEMSVVHKGVQVVAYEPPSAIGSGNPDDPEHIDEVFKQILEQNPGVKLLYGGSVNPKNINTFKEITNLSGFLVGGASLEASEFLSLL